jgi:hypothetical protein
VPLEDIGFPNASDARTPVTVMGTFPGALPGEIVKVAEPTDPLGMTLVLRSYITQVVDPPPLEHEVVLGPPANVTPVIFAG